MTEYPWLLRNEYDQRMHREVYVENEYQLPDDMKGKLVLDIGGNVGSFARLCAERGANVFAVEPSIDNWNTLWSNVAGCPSVKGRRCAATAEEGPTELYTCTNPTAFSLLKTHGNDRTSEIVYGVPVGNLALEAMTAHNAMRIDLCKIDAEGAEYLIIPSWDFAPVRELIVEFHGDFVEEYETQAALCRTRLSSLGFRETRWETMHPECGWLRIYRGVK